jgi:lysophospholipase L1-like esterase
MQIIRFILSFFIILLMLSLISLYMSTDMIPLRSANLISDIFKSDLRVDTEKVDISRDNRPIMEYPTSPAVTSVYPMTDSLQTLLDFERYKRPDIITDFRTDTSMAALHGLIEKLRLIKKGSRSRIRIAYIGDSVIEGDLICQTLRRFMQERYGGTGVGFVHTQILSSDARATAIVSLSGEWSDKNFNNDRKETQMFLSGHLTRSGGGSIRMSDRSVKSSEVPVEIELFSGPSDKPVTIGIEGKYKVIHPQASFNIIHLAKGQRRNMSLSFPASSMPIYGISFASDSGVIIDDLPMRGLTGMELSQISAVMLSDIGKAMKYDLIILHFGLNLIGENTKGEFSWYRKYMVKVIDKLRSTMPETEILIIGCSDIAIRSSNGYKTPVYLDKLVKEQAALAKETGSGFFNLFETMGGANTMVKWVNANPSMASKDYMHPNSRGSEWIGEKIFKAILREESKDSIIQSQRQTVNR